MTREACPNENSACKYFNLPDGCFADTHHIMWPRSDYRTPTEKRFRELDENKVQLCRADHDTEHALFDIPVKPSVDVMRHAIQQARLRHKGADNEPVTRTNTNT